MWLVYLWLAATAGFLLGLFWAGRRDRGDE